MQRCKCNPSNPTLPWLWSTAYPNRCHQPNGCPKVFPGHHAEAPQRTHATLGSCSRFILMSLGCNCVSVKHIQQAFFFESVTVYACSLFIREFSIVYWPSSRPEAEVARAAQFFRVLFDRNAAQVLILKYNLYSFLQHRQQIVVYYEYEYTALQSCSQQLRNMNSIQMPIIFIIHFLMSITVFL